MRFRVFSLMLAAAVGLGGLAAYAQDGDVEAPTPEQIKAMMAAAKSGKGKDAKKKKKDYPPYADVIEDHKKLGGDEKTLFTLWYNKKDDSLLCEVPKSMVGDMFLTAMTVSGGTPVTGAQAGHTVVKWEQFGKQLLLIEPDLRYENAKGSSVADVVARTYNDTILKSVPIKTMSPGGDPVIDMGDLLKGAPPGFSGVSVASNLSKWGEVKAFPKNVELPVELAVGNPRGGTMGRLVLHFSMSELPKNAGYKPRRADDRIGYFLTVRKDWGKGHGEKTLFDRYVNRWDLQKVNPELALSPVKKPIVWYIEDSVPVRWRRYVKDGILEWNMAFEKLGFLDAVQVRQQTETEFADLDPADVRYNFFRWIVSGRAFAMGPSRDHPLTGEILDADIIMDDSMVRVYAQRLPLYSKKGSTGSFWYENDPMLNEFLEANPAWDFDDQLTARLPETAEMMNPETSFVDELIAKIQKRNHIGPSCNYAEGLAQELAFDAACAQAAGEEGLPDEYLGQIIKEIVAHEVGHCLGLRHNFKASTWISMEDALASDDEDAATTGSVMDYNPTLYAVPGAEQGNFVTRTIGPYDYWAIEYGYRPVEKPYKSEDEMLKAITDRVAEEGLAYTTDEDTMFFSPDPHSNRFDYGSDPMDYAKHQQKLVGNLRDGLEDWAVEDGESYNRLRKTLNVLLGAYGRPATFVARYVGGVHVNRDHKGDPDARDPFVPVSADKQREALDFVCDTIFDDGAWEFSPSLLNKLAAGRYGHWDSDEFDLEVEYPIHDVVGRIQYQSLFQMMNPWTISRLYDCEKQCEDAFTLSEMMETLTGRIWSELEDTPKGKSDAYISSFRRGLQRRQLGLLIAIALMQPNGLMPADAHALTTMTLSDLKDQIDERLDGSKGKMDAYSRAHLADSRRKIEQALDAVYNVR